MPFVVRVYKEYLYREKIAEEVLTTFKIDCDPWGITVERVEV